MMRQDVAYQMNRGHDSLLDTVHHFGEEVVSDLRRVTCLL